MAINKWFNPTFSWGNVGVILTVIVSFSITFGSLTSEVKSNTENLDQITAVVSGAVDDLRQTQLIVATLVETVAQVREVNGQTLARMEQILTAISQIRESLVRVQTLVDNPPG